jgi:hypothetical protein
MVADNGERTLAFDLEMEPIEAISIALHSKICDRPGDRSQHIHHGSDIPIGRLRKHVVER